MKGITHLFFDLDHTLWDYDTNARAVLKEIFKRYELAQVISRDCQFFMETFFTINDELWYAYNLGQIDKEAIRTERFARIIRKCGGDNEELSAAISEYYLFNCPKQPTVMPDALMVLDYLRKKYQLSIITNGFEDVQYIKLRASRLDRFFSHVFTSERAGHKKPAREIFDFAMKTLEITADQVLMIGDNPNTDIQGARNAGIKPLLFNPTGLVKSDCELEINRLSELMSLL